MKDARDAGSAPHSDEVANRLAAMLDAVEESESALFAARLELARWNGRTAEKDSEIRALTADRDRLTEELHHINRSLSVRSFTFWRWLFLKFVGRGKPHP
jgi:hypothetical protein